MGNIQDWIISFTPYTLDLVSAIYLSTRYFSCSKLSFPLHLHHSTFLKYELLTKELIESLNRWFFKIFVVSDCWEISELTSLHRGLRADPSPKGKMQVFGCVQILQQKAKCMISAKLPYLLNHSFNFDVLWYLEFYRML